MVVPVPALKPAVKSLMPQVLVPVIAVPVPIYPDVLYPPEESPS
jgi:hypothetical protein